MRCFPGQLVFAPLLLLGACTSYAQSDPVYFTVPCTTPDSIRSGSPSASTLPNSESVPKSEDAKDALPRADCIVITNSNGEALTRYGYGRGYNVPFYGTRLGYYRPFHGGVGFSYFGGAHFYDGGGHLNSHVGAGHSSAGHSSGGHSGGHH